VLTWILDFTNNVPRDEMLQAKDNIEQVMMETLSSLPYNIISNNTDSTLNYHLTYKNMDGLFDRIKLDLNFRSRAHVLPPMVQLFKTPFHESPIEVRGLQKEEIFGQKLKALLERTKARDLFDTYNLITKLKTDPGFLNKELLHKIFQGRTLYVSRRDAFVNRKRD
jgi:predicted nucleotidyltransferase component of viral defense system